MRIEAEDIEAIIGGKRILRGVKLEAGDWELVGVIGPNGSGKSTLLKCIYRVLQPTGGAVYLDGRSLSSFNYKESARRLAVVAQHNYYNFDFSVKDVVLMERAPHKRTLDRDNAEDYRMICSLHRDALSIYRLNGNAEMRFRLSHFFYLIQFQIVVSTRSDSSSCSRVMFGYVS